MQRMLASSEPKPRWPGPGVAPAVVRPTEAPSRSAVMRPRLVLAMSRRPLWAGALVVSIAATTGISGGVVPNGRATTSLTIPRASVREGCPPRGERIGYYPASLEEVVSAAQRVLYREITHFQGRNERRSALNTPVAAAVMDLGFLTPARVQGQRSLQTRAARICGKAVARESSAVMFDDGLNIVCCLPPITLFVVRTDRVCGCTGEARGAPPRLVGELDLRLGQMAVAPAGEDAAQLVRHGQPFARKPPVREPRSHGRPAASRACAPDTSVRRTRRPCPRRSGSVQAREADRSR